MERRGLLGALALSVVCSAGVECRADLVVEWNSRLIQTIRELGTGHISYPGPISRAGTIMHIAIYDAVNSIERTHEPYFGFEDCPPGTSMDAAIAAAAHTALCGVYSNPFQVEKFDTLLAAHLAAIPDGPAKDAGIALGQSCAERCLADRVGDGSEDFIVYEYGVGPGHWVPTFPNFSGPATPHWPDVRPWCLTSGDQFRPESGPYGYDTMAEVLASPEYAADFEDVRVNGALFSPTRTEDQTTAALFWANDRNGTFKPPGHLYHITQRIAEVQGNTVVENARLFALVSLGMADASIAAWDTKYSTDIDFWRPITAIWEADTDGNPDTVAEPGWLGLSYDPSVLIFNPSFPAWASGHATFGAVHAAVVRNYYGTDNITFTATSDDTPGYWREFTSLSQAAIENGRSRVWLGVHWQVDSDDAYIIGTSVGDYVSANYLRVLGDLNGDGLVNSDDLGILLGGFGGAGAEGDINRDGVVDSDDLGLLLGNFG
ncbi:MAG: vanadium-dependent haloperoxidase [Phycisphaerales bacterium]